MAGIMEVFKIIILAQLFYAAGITMLAYGIPDEARNYVTGFSELGETINLEGVSSDVESSLQSQTNIPLIELGALVFYSGNILMDLLLNFAFAIPQMFTTLINGLLFIFNIDVFVTGVVQLFFSVIVMTFYAIGLIQLVTGLRSGRLVT